MAKAVKGKIDTPTEGNTGRETEAQPEAALQADDGKSDYVVCENAPPRVAGRRVRPGERLRLAETEALGELLALHIRPVTERADSSPDPTASNPV